jgi:hypothetical protein
MASWVLIHVLPLGLQNPPRVPPHGGLGVDAAVVVTVVVACSALTAVILLLDRRRQRVALLEDEREVRAEMEKLCPDGWRAQITAYGEQAPLPDDAPPAPGPLVSVDWAEYTRTPAGDARVAVMRRSWGHSIVGALRAMVADRRLDLTLEEIEQRVENDTRL